MAYAVRADIEAVFGTEAVKQWADLENTQVEADITARVTAALLFAQDEVDNRLRGGPYVIPLDEPPDQIIVDIVAKVAGVWLYESRGVQDFDAETGTPQHKLHWHKRDSSRKLDDLLSGRRRLNISASDKTRKVTPEVVL